jgi:hypothetical protein
MLKMIVAKPEIATAKTTNNVVHVDFASRSRAQLVDAKPALADEVNSGLTLHSNYHGTGHSVNTLKVTASNAAEAISSAAQTITVTDPPATTGDKIALLCQYMASMG